MVQEPDLYDVRGQHVEARGLEVLHPFPAAPPPSTPKQFHRVSNKGGCDSRKKSIASGGSCAGDELNISAWKRQKRPPRNKGSHAKRPLSAIALLSAVIEHRRPAFVIPAHCRGVRARFIT